MHRYAHGGDVYGACRPVLDFSISLNPMGPPPQVLEAAQRAISGWNRYPDPRCRELRQAAAQREGVLEEQLIFGNGASDLIDRLLRVVKPRKALLLAPTFSEYRRILEGLGGEIQEFSLEKENYFTVRESFLTDIQPGVDLVFLCDPNNPTGRRMEPALLQAVLDRCRKVGAFLAVDQCFLELSQGGADVLTAQLEGGGLFLLRALTKSYALAGLRLGYGLCGDRDLLSRMEALGTPWPVSAPAQAAGTCAFEEFPNWPQDCLPAIAREVLRVTETMEGLGLWVCPSQANFLLFQGPEGLGERLLREEGILLRDCANYSGLGSGWYRAGLQREEANTRLLQGLERSLRKD